MFPASDLECFRSQTPPVASESPGVGALRAGKAIVPLARLLQSIADEIRGFFDVQTAIVSVAPDGNWEKAISGMSSVTLDATGQLESPVRRDFASCWLAGPVSRVIRLADADLRPHVPPEIPSDLPFGRVGATGWLLAPLVDSQTRNIGTVQLNGKRMGDFTAQDETCLLHFSRIAAFALENTLEARATAPPEGGQVVSQDLVNLEAEIGQTLARTDDLNILLQACTESIVRRLGLAFGRLWVARGGVLELQASAGLSVSEQDERARVPVGQFTIGHVTRTRAPYLTHALGADSTVHDKGWAQSQGLTAYAGFPLLCGAELVGVLALYDHKPISQASFDAVVALCDMIALEIRRQRPDKDSGSFAKSSIRATLVDFHTEQAVIVTGGDDRIADWNAGAARFFGYRREDVIGQSLEILIPPERLREHREFLSKIAGGEIVSCPETSRMRNGRTPVDVSLTGAALRDSRGQQVGTVWLVQNLAEIKRLQQQYRQAQKMEVFGQLAGGVAHDFNNLLTIILGYVELVLGRLEPGNSLRDFLGEIYKASQRAEALTRQLLAFSRKKNLDAKILDLNAAISETEKMLRRLIGEDILTTTIFSPSLKPIRIDACHLQQVILNLAINARDAMPGGGRLTIETSAVDLDQLEATTHPLSRSGEFVKIAVSDTGVGMDQATKARLFEPLFTTKGPGKGTGLGLVTVLSIVEQNGGFIEVESEIGHGTTFSVYLPAADEPISLGAPHPHLRMIPRGSETVLLVEDEDSVRALVRQILHTCGYTVFEAENGEEALGIAQRIGNAIQLLVTDVVMPHLGGRRLADRLRETNPGLRVLFLSGYTSEAVTGPGAFDAESAFLQKPFTTGALAQKIREVLDQPAHQACT